MDLVMDRLSVILLGGISVLAVVHLVLLRKPDPATHPLILGRQSDVDKVRRPGESPVFISSTTGLGGLAKQLVKGYKSIHDIYEAINAQEGSKPVNIVIGTAGKEAVLADKVNALAGLMKQDSELSSNALSIKLEDPTDALVTMLAASRLSDATGVKPPLMLFNASGVSQYGSSPIAVSTADLQTLKTIPAERSQSSNTDEKGTIYLINSGPQPPNMDPLKFLPSNWQIARRIGIENMPVASAQKIGKESDKNDTAACFVRMQIVSGFTEGIAEVAHRHLLQGGLISLMSIFPPNDKPTPADSILSFESTSTPYGLSVAMMCAAVGATFRLCTPQKGIVARCKASAPSIIFCTPNELNAIRAAMFQILPKEGGIIYPLAKAHKMSLLNSGNVSKTTMWDNMIFGRIREGIIGSRLRCIICSAEEGAGPTAEVVDFMRMALGVPVVVVMTHPLVAGPVTNSLFHDFQRFPSASKTNGYAHVGAPSATIESKLIGVNDDLVKSGVYEGELAIRGPSVLRSFIRSPEASDMSLENGWTRTGVMVELQKNGTLKPVKGK